MKLYRFDPEGKKGGKFVIFADIQPAIDAVFEKYEKSLEAAIKTGYLEDKEIFAIQSTIKNLREKFKVEAAN
jgi:hypothetical protein